VTLPLYYEMTDADVETVIGEVTAFLRTGATIGDEALLREG